MKYIYFTILIIQYISAISKSDNSLYSNIKNYLFIGSKNNNDKNKLSNMNR